MINQTQNVNMYIFTKITSSLLYQSNRPNSNRIKWLTQSSSKELFEIHSNLVYLVYCDRLGMVQVVVDGRAFA